VKKFLKRRLNGRWLFLWGVGLASLVALEPHLWAVGLVPAGVPEVQETVFVGAEPLEAKLNPRFSSQQVTAGFGLFGELDFSGTRLRSLRQSYGLMSAGTELRFPSELQPAPACGPSRRQNEMVCVNQKTGELISQLPIPGTVSAAPLFHKGSWLVATSKGFLFRVNGLSPEGAPVLGMENLSFWGAESRERMRYLRELYRQELDQLDTDGQQKRGAGSGVDGHGSDLDFVQVGWGWYLWSSSEFVSHFVVQGTRLVAQTANQFVYAIDYESGRTVWAQRIGTDEDLRLQTAALAVTARSVVVGTASGEVLLLNPNTGAVDWRRGLRSAPGDRFPGVVATPLVIGQKIVASSSTGETVLINERTQQVEWSLPYGSTASPRRLGDSVLLGTSDGLILKVDVASGQIQRRLDLGRQSPVASLFVLPSERLILLGLIDGTVQVRTAADFSLVQTFPSMGVFEGEFTGSPGVASTCITVKEAALRCFEAF
jgi:outer membrane protein assembly factor BamB